MKKWRTSTLHCRITRKRFTPLYQVSASRNSRQARRRRRMRKSQFHRSQSPRSLRKSRKSSRPSSLPIHLQPSLHGKAKPRRPRLQSRPMNLLRGIRKASRPSPSIRNPHGKIPMRVQALRLLAPLMRGGESHSGSTRPQRRIREARCRLT